MLLREIPNKHGEAKFSNKRKGSPMMKVVKDATTPHVLHEDGNGVETAEL